MMYLSNVVVEGAAHLSHDPPEFLVQIPMDGRNLEHHRRTDRWKLRTCPSGLHHVSGASCQLVQALGARGRLCEYRKHEHAGLAVASDGDSPRKALAEYHGAPGILLVQIRVERDVVVLESSRIRERGPTRGDEVLDDLLRHVVLHQPNPANATFSTPTGACFDKPYSMSSAYGTLFETTISSPS